MIAVGIDDTDVLESPGTNQLARRLVGALPPGLHATIVLRHQLLFDPRIPYTSHNGSASIAVVPDVRADRPALVAALVEAIEHEMRAWYVPGSDPGFCVAATEVMPEVVAFGQRCQRELVTQEEARAVAQAAGVVLQGLGGTEGGVIGALAAVGLLAEGNDGRVIHLPGWTWPDDFAGPQPVAEVYRRGVDEVRELGTEMLVARGVIDVGKHLRPNRRAGRVVLFVESAGPERWRAVKQP